jgi:hypothetical protein
MQRSFSVSVCAPNGVREEIPNKVCGQNEGRREEGEGGRREEGGKRGRGTMNVGLHLRFFSC